MFKGLLLISARVCFLLIIVYVFRAIFIDGSFLGVISLISRGFPRFSV